jgi:hypothetical protein
VDLLASVICKSNIEADFLASFELDHSPVMDHQLDGPVADGSERLAELVEERLGQWERVTRGRVFSGRGTRLRAHDPIYPI